MLFAGNVLNDFEDDLIDAGYHERMTFLYLDQTLAQRYGLFSVFDITADNLPGSLLFKCFNNRVNIFSTRH
jgi:hypothetical protein